MNYTLLSSTSSLQKEESKTSSFLYCDYCKNPMQEWGFIHILNLSKTKEIKFLCSPLCKRKYKWVKECPECGKHFDSMNRNPTKTNQHYCSLKCYRKSRQQECGSCISCGKKIEGFEKNKLKPKKFCTECKVIKGNYRYNTHYFCDSCRYWIKIEDSIRREDTKRTNYYVCPKLGCNGNRLKINSRHSKDNLKRKKPKRIE